ncbi:MAG: isocitrate lyase/PEP mutase family protein [Burkholderiales bacterium]|nr:isocitrate lyase/PEP mutase family protein [Burkholderiales bacterium]
MRWTERRERFRAILEGKACVHPASVFDPVSARIAEDLGFELGMFAGSIASLAVLGAPDQTLITLTEFAEQAHRICRAGALPLLVDADHGYGNALNVMRTVEELETAGIAALTIEDTSLPQAYGGGAGAKLIPLEEGVGKMKAALAARRDPRLAVVGRTSALAVNGLDDALARGRAYEAAGVDALFFLGVRTRVQLEALAAGCRIPIVLGGVGADLNERDFLGAHGVRISLQGHQPFMAAVAAVHETMTALREGTPPARLANLASAQQMQQLSRDADYARWSESFLGGAGK